MGDSQGPSQIIRDSGPGPAGAQRVVRSVGAILASAFLIFLVQPMVGKRIPPWFGRVPAVWTLCLAFYIGFTDGAERSA